MRSAYATSEGKICFDRNNVGPNMVISVPYHTCKKAWSKELNTRVYEYEPIPDFAGRLDKALGGKKDAKVIVFDVDGKEEVYEALEALEEMEYTDFVGLRGGYQLYDRTFDGKQNRRVWAEFKEDYMHGADTCGIHASGAGFAKMDGLETGWAIIR